MPFAWTAIGVLDILAGNQVKWHTSKLELCWPNSKTMFLQLMKCIYEGGGERVVVEGILIKLHVTVSCSLSLHLSPFLSWEVDPIYL